ncbi:MAG: acetyl-CoA carboxylase biotin carboxyl carrier protein [Trueperaceae bacterium]|nr:acetyl-CoA carboxylase biotin carboxyl carrier protein [Trueperaceae bacterium]
MEVRDVKRLIDAMAATDLSELEYEQRDGDGTAVFRITLRKGSSAVAASHVATAAPTVAAPPAATESGASASGSGTAAAPATQRDHLVDVAAPIVGTFYASAAPDVAPYVKVGDRVKAGAILCIIEAMKLMNEIESEVAGTIVEVLVDNEDPVEYGQVLFRIDPG